MIDTHTHLNFPELEHNLGAVLERAKKAGVTKFIIPGCDAASSASGVALGEQFDSIYPAVGIHPTEATTYNQEELERLVELVEGVNGLVAIGEVGLDYYHMEDCKTEVEKEERKKAQQVLFIDMITLAKDYQLPLIIHCRDAFEDTLQILEEQAPNHPTVIHCFTGTSEEAKAWIEYGALLSFTGVITYKKNEALREVVKETPLEHMMLETDSPYLAPEGMRGQTNEPQYVMEVAKCVATIKGIPVAEVDRVTTETAEDFFGV